MGELILNGLIAVFQPVNLVVIFLGVAVGIFMGALPGISVTLAVALVLTFTFGMGPTAALFLLLGTYVGGIYGGSISAILIRAPGTPASAATVADGYALARKGRAGEALRVALFASTVAGIFSALMLLFLAPQLARVALQFGPPEFFALALFGLTIISNVSGDSVVKGVIMGMLGLFVATIGIDPIGGVPRMTFGITNLQGGVSLIPALIGLFAVSELVDRARVAHVGVEEENTVTDTRLPFSTAIRYLKTILKGSVIGTFIGAIPGTGSAISAFISYNEAKRASQNKEEFGEGSLDGIAAAESGNNGVTGATLIPLLTLGIPGDTVTAVMLGALLVQGLIPGPQLFTEHADIVYTIMVGLIFVNIVMYIMGRFAIRLFARVASIPINLLIPLLLILCFVGAYAVNNTVFDAKLMLLFGLVGYFAPKYGFPVTPMLLGIVLGPIAEESLRQALILSDGSWGIFVTEPIALVFILLALASFTLPILKPYFSGSR